MPRSVLACIGVIVAVYSPLILALILATRFYDTLLSGYVIAVLWLPYQRWFFEREKRRDA